jgi:hypothetical protein
LKADALVLSDNDPVTTWADSSSAANNVTQATGSKKPLYKTGIINAKPVVRFDASDDNLNKSAFDLSATNAISGFAVFTAAAGGGDRMIVDIGDGTAGNGNWNVARVSANTVQANHFGDVGLSGWETTGTLTTTPKCVCVITDRTLTTNETKIYLNGTQDGAATSNNNNGTGNFSATYPINVGSRGNGTSLPSGADIAEIIVYAIALGTTVRQSVERYLSAKYALGF